LTSFIPDSPPSCHPCLPALRGSAIGGKGAARGRLLNATKELRRWPKTKGKKAAGAKKPPARKEGAAKAPGEKAATPETAPKAEKPAEPKDAYRTALAPYREACHKVGVACEYEGGRSANVSEKVTFLVEKTDKGVRVMVKGQPKTEEVIPLAALKESVNREAYRYAEAHIGPREKVGNKGGSLSNRLRAVLNA
jgi:hypothetical protein